MNTNANEGGIGVISSVGIGLLVETSRRSFREKNQYVLQKEIRKARKLSDGLLGLNIMVAISDYDDLVRLAYDEEIDIIFLGAGLPLKLPPTLSVDRLRSAHTKVAVIVSSARAAQIIFQSWRASPGGSTAFRTRPTRLSLFTKVPFFSAKATPGKMTSA